MEEIKIVSCGAYEDAYCTSYVDTIRIFGDLYDEWMLTRDEYRHRGSQKYRDEMCNAWEGMPYTDYKRRQNERYIAWSVKIVDVMHQMDGWTVDSKTDKITIVPCDHDYLFTVIWDVPKDKTHETD